MSYERKAARKLFNRFLQTRSDNAETAPGTLAMESALDFIIEVSSAMDAIASIASSSNSAISKEDTIRHIASFYQLGEETPQERFMRLQEELNKKYPEGIPEEICEELSEHLQELLD